MPAPIAYFLRAPHPTHPASGQRRPMPSNTPPHHTLILSPAPHTHPAAGSGQCRQSTSCGASQCPGCTPTLPTASTAPPSSQSACRRAGGREGGGQGKRQAGGNKVQVGQRDGLRGRCAELRAGLCRARGLLGLSWPPPARCLLLPFPGGQIWVRCIPVLRSPPLACLPGMRTRAFPSHHPLP